MPRTYQLAEAEKRIEALENAARDVLKRVSSDGILKNHPKRDFRRVEDGFDVACAKLNEMINI